MITQSFLDANLGAVRKGITCADGFFISVQASHFHYCSPRQDEGPWDTVEVGFPSQPEEMLLMFAEDRDKPTESVYGYVPIEIVDSVILRHGGIK